MAPVDRAIAAELRGLVDAEHPVAALTPPFGSPHLRALPPGARRPHAMLAMLPGEDRVIGTIMLANRFGLERGFSADDLRLFEALANNASVALQYDRLEQAVTKLHALQDQLHHQAYHDPLTELANRALFMQRVREELGRRRAPTARAVHRPRRLQDRQRLARPRRRRRAAASRSPTGCARCVRPRTPSPASAATSSP